MRLGRTTAAKAVIPRSGLSKAPRCVFRVGSYETRTGGLPIASLLRPRSRGEHVDRLAFMQAPLYGCQVIDIGFLALVEIAPRALDTSHSCLQHGLTALQQSRSANRCRRFVRHLLIATPVPPATKEKGPGLVSAEARRALHGSATLVGRARRQCISPLQTNSVRSRAR
jgi:hypothetical protein